MAYRSFEQVHWFAAEPDRVWDLLVDPVTIVELEEHGSRVEPLVSAPVTVGDRWTEVHGAECDGDRVPWRVVASSIGSSLVEVGSQRGVRQTITSTIHPHDGGTLLTVKVVFSPGLSGRPGQQVLPWLLLAVGLLGKLGAAQESPLFANMERRLSAHAR
ncbi:SRPBCC family protein [Cellulomonas sp. URHB0016]